MRAPAQACEEAFRREAGVGCSVGQPQRRQIISPEEALARKVGGVALIVVLVGLVVAIET